MADPLTKSKVESRGQGFLKNQRRRGGVGLQHKKSSITRTERAPEQSRYNKKSSTSRTGRAPDQRQENKREGWSLSTHLYNTVLLIFNCNILIVEEGIIF